MKNHQLVQDLYFKIVNTFAKIDVELANMLFAQSDSFLRNLNAEVGTYLLFAHCGCRKWSALTITSTFIHHNCHHQHIEGRVPNKECFLSGIAQKGVVDNLTQLICTWILICFMTKPKEHSREICYERRELQSAENVNHNFHD